MTTTIYGIKNCDTMKKARAWLDKHGVAYDFHDYKTAGIERDRLERWSKKVGWETLLNRAGTTFKKLPDKDKQDLDREEGDRADAGAAVDDQAAGARSRRRQAPGRLQARALRRGGGTLSAGHARAVMTASSVELAADSPLHCRRFAEAPPHPIMPIDSFTVLLFGLFIKLVLGALFVVFWLKNRAAPWFGWWSATLLLGSVTSALLHAARRATAFSASASAMPR